MPYKIYTKTGDKGETGLFGGKRVSKSDLRVEAYGSIDELNAFIGQLKDLIPNLTEITPVLSIIQDRLFTVGAYLASDPEKNKVTPDLLPEDLDLLEQSIDHMEAALPPLKNFILPGGHPAVSAAHICRTVCRRAERVIVALHQIDPVKPEVLEYINRLSDYFFVAGRKIALDLQIQEILWKPRK